MFQGMNYQKIASTYDLQDLDVEDKPGEANCVNVTNSLLKLKFSLCVRPSEEDDMDEKSLAK